MREFSRHLAIGAGTVTCMAGSLLLWGFRSDLTALTWGVTSAMGIAYLYGTIGKAFDGVRQHGKMYAPFKIEQPVSRTQEAINKIYDAYKPIVEPLEQEIVDKMSKTAMTEPIKLSGCYAEAAILDKYIGLTLNLPLRIHYERKGAVIVTPLYYLYRLDQIQGKPFNIGLLTDQVLEQIEQQSAGFRKKSKNKEVRETPVRADVLRSQPPYLRITNPLPTPNIWRSEKYDQFVTCLGTVYQPKAEPVLLDLGGKDCTVPNGLFCGMPRMGKSRTIHAALLGLLRSTPPQKLHVYALETKTNGYSIYEGLPHMKQIVGSLKDVVPVLEQFQQWCTWEGRPTDGAIRLLIFDEFQLAVTNKEVGKRVEELMEDIMSRGAEAGIRVWIATQVPDKPNYPSNLKGKTHFYVVCKIKVDTYVKTVFQIHGAPSLRPKLEFLYSGDGDLQKVAAFDLPDGVLLGEIEALKSRYGTATGSATGSATDCRSSATVSATTATVSATHSSATSGRGRSTTGATVNATGVGGVYMLNSTTNFPLSEVRPLTPEELDHVSQQIALGNPALLFKGNVGLNKLTTYLYGKTSPAKYREAKKVMGQLGIELESGD